MAMKLDMLREKALANLELLFDHWKLEYTKVDDDEYDFINPTRNDNNFGACRFNKRKGLGADFTGASFSELDFKQIGIGFDRSDFGTDTKAGQTSFGFDIIGLTQRIFNCATYRDAANLLSEHLTNLSKTTELVKADITSAIKRQFEADERNKKIVEIAKKTWNVCLPVEGTIGEKYLHSRSIRLNRYPTSIRYRSKIYNAETKGVLPAILFKVSLGLNTPLEAIHRVYIKEDGSGKANLHTPKAALGKIKGLGIWFGEENSTLYICEGPENALSILSLGFKFVVSTIDSANFPNLTIPTMVKQIVLMPDGDEAGVTASKKAIKAYENIELKINFPPKKEDNPKWDWNDQIKEQLSRGSGVTR